MEFVLLAGVIGGAAWLAGAAIRAACQGATDRRTATNSRNAVAERLQRQRAEREAQRREQLRRLNAKARVFQLALLQITRAHDFRRAASFAAHARDVPASFRQRQFRRFRPLLLRHFIARMRAGTEENVLLQSLRELLGHLSVPAYEADYLHTEAQAALAAQAVPEAQPSYAQRLLELQRAHAQRMEALRSLRDLDQETREQLLEAEESRFRQALQDLSTEETDATGP